MKKSIIYHCSLTHQHIYHGTGSRLSLEPKVMVDYVTGGRGGEIVHVTNLNDSGTGSFREAVKSGKRIIVFDVAGVIALKSDLKIQQTTSPSSDRQLPRQASPCAIIPFNRGATISSVSSAFAVDRKRTSTTELMLHGSATRRESFYDHCSFSWSIDEVASFYDNNNFTMQWCTVAESLTNPGHSKGAHGYGGIWGR